MAGQQQIDIGRRGGGVIAGLVIQDNSKLAAVESGRQGGDVCTGAAKSQCLGGILPSNQIKPVINGAVT